MYKLGKFEESIRKERRGTHPFMAQLKGVMRRIIVYPRGPVLKTQDGIDVFPFGHFSDLLAGNNL